MEHSISKLIEEQNFAFTDHAYERAHQRSFPMEVLKAVMAYADIFHPTGKGCELVTMSQFAHEDARTDGLPLKTLERAKGIQLVLSKNGAVITPYKRASNRCRTKRQSRSRRGGWRRF